MSPTDLFGMGPQTHKTAAREKLLELPDGKGIRYEDAYRECRGLPNRPEAWQASVRDELHRLRDGGYFTEDKTPDGSVFTRTGRN